MTLQLRQYQREAIDALFAFWAQGGGNGLIVLPTGAGKSLVIAQLVRELLEQWPGLRIGIVAHVRELLSQNGQEMLRLWPTAPIGFYSAGLNRRDSFAQVLFMGIQSVHNRARQLGKFDLLIIDEAHMIPRTSDTMYGRFIEACRDLVDDIRIVGLTATPFRLDSGRLDKGREALFDTVVYDARIPSLINDGFLSPLISKAARAEIDTSGVSVRAGEFVAGELERAASMPEIVAAAATEIVAFGEGRRGWLAFCSGVAHALQVRDELRRRGVICETITGETPAGERDRIIEQFKRGEIRCLTSVAVLCIGFNAPHVDLIAMLRPTLSTGLYVQMIGRGFRLAPGKEDCLVLDFAGNVRRHGPVDEVLPANKRNAKEKDEDEERGKVKPDTIRAKECPNCQTLAALHVFKCPNPHCDYEWPQPEKPKHAPAADAETPILTSERARIAPKWVSVDDVSFHRHVKQGGGTPTLRVEYETGMNTVREWWCLEHPPGFARDKAGSIWRMLGGDLPCPRSIDEALSRVHELNKITEIQIRAGANGYFEVFGRRTRPWEEHERPKPPRSWFQILGVSPRADRIEIERAFRERAKVLHPDLGGSTEAMQELNAAREAAFDALEEIPF